jgi:uncharacterized protein YprB with RNaseH-like and TPR domain
MELSYSRFPRVIMDLKDRLGRLHSTSREAGRPREETISDLRRRLERLVDPRRIKRTEKEVIPITELVEGEEVVTPYGTVFMRQQVYGSGYRHGEMLLDRVMEIPTYPVSLLSSDENLRDLDFSQTLFLDVETTGLAGGTGTYAFLVGVGYFEQSRFVTRQFFLRDFSEERAMLWVLAEVARRSRFLATFNGKRFDIPLLETRFIISRMECPLNGLPNYDLLFPSRRIWKGAYEDCRLATLESGVLGIYRDDDVPSEMIPYIYFDYLSSGNGNEIHRLFYHNRLDVLSLVTLAARIHELVHIPQTASKSEWFESYSLGKLLDRVGRRGEAIERFNDALRFCRDSQEWEILKSLSLAMKREKQMDQAASIWVEMISLDRSRELFPYEELAKFYEHQLKDYGEAMRWVGEAFERLQFLSPTEREALGHRYRRLGSRIERKRIKDKNEG